MLEARFFRSLFFVTAVAVLTGCAPKEAEETEAVTQVSDNPGAQLFEANCQACHGMYAIGDGPLAAELAVAPPDLTRLIDKYGSFPVELVSMTIDGRAEVESHGTREMPVWGNIWNDPAGGALAEERVQEQIAQLVEFLRMIQAPPTVPTTQ